MKKKVVSVVAAVTWYVLVLALAYWIGSTIRDWTGSPIAAVPVAIIYVILVLLAGRPRLLRPPGTRHVLRIRKVPPNERLTLGKKIWPFSIVQIVKLKKRFTVPRTATLVAANVILLGAVALPTVEARINEMPGPGLDPLVDYQPIITTQVFEAGGKEICRWHGVHDRVLVPLKDMPPYLPQAFMAAEDRDFYSHGGLNFLAIARALRTNYLTGSQQGGSGITQQTIKGVLHPDEPRTLARKVQEMIESVKVEKLLTKDEILYRYLSTISLGHNYEGVGAASRGYFGKHPRDLTLAEAAMLAGLPKAPGQNAPDAAFPRARARQVYVIGQMVKAGFITQEQADAALAEEITLVSHSDQLNNTAAPYFCRRVYYNLKAQYGVDGILNRGMVVHTSLDLSKQMAAEAALRDGLVSLERRISFNGPEGHDDAYVNCSGTVQQVGDGFIDEARVASAGDQPTVCLRGTVYPLHAEDVGRIRQWSAKSGKRLQVGDVMSAKIITEGSKRYAIAARRTDGPEHPEGLQGAMMVTNNRTGEVVAYVGGYDYNRNQWDSAYQAMRQPGSSIKPYVYGCALEKGMPPDYMVLDAPISVPTASGVWSPTNYRSPTGGRQYYGRVDVQTALAQSLNSVSVRLMMPGATPYSCSVEEVIDFMRRLGITSPLERVMPLAVGATALTLWEHTFAYTAIAAGGKKLPKHPWSKDSGVFIRSIIDAKGETVYAGEHQPREEWPQAVPAGVAAELLYLKKAVVQFGTGKRLQVLGIPLGGKSGTTNNAMDVWFIVVSEEFTASVWVGRLTTLPITKNATGGSVALPILSAALQQMFPDAPPREFALPDDVTLVRDKKGALMPVWRGHLPERLLGSVESPVIGSRTGLNARQ